MEEIAIVKGWKADRVLLECEEKSEREREGVRKKCRVIVTENEYKEKTVYSKGQNLGGEAFLTTLGVDLAILL